MPRRWKLFLLIAPTVIVLDQATKLWARSTLPTDSYGNGIPVSVVENFFDWILAYNTGSAFSMFAGTAGSRVFLTVIGLLALGIIIWMVKKAENHQTWTVLSLSLMAGGAIGNLIDRILTGKVTDFVLWRYYEYKWPVFNIADMCLSVAVAVFIVAGLFGAKPSKTNAKTAKAVSTTSAKAGSNTDLDSEGGDTSDEPNPSPPSNPDK